MDSLKVEHWIGLNMEAWILLRWVYTEREHERGLRRWSSTVATRALKFTWCYK